MNPPTEAVERVARAISDANWRPTCTSEFLDAQFNDECLHSVYLQQATAALHAMQPEEPALNIPPDEKYDVVKRIADAVCLDVCELPDRSSPEDWPEACLVTTDELHDLVSERVAEALADYLPARAAMQPAIDAAVLVDAFLAGCNEMYDAWVAGDGQREADFTEAANDYAEQVSIKAGGWQPIETEPAYEAAFRDGFRACVARPLRTMDDDPQAEGGMRGSPRGDAYHAACNAVSDAIRKVPT